MHFEISWGRNNKLELGHVSNATPDKPGWTGVSQNIRESVNQHSANVDFIAASN